MDELFYGAVTTTRPKRLGSPVPGLSSTATRSHSVTETAGSADGVDEKLIDFIGIGWGWDGWMETSTQVDTGFRQFSDTKTKLFEGDGRAIHALRITTARRPLETGINSAHGARAQVAQDL